MRNRLSGDARDYIRREIDKKARESARKFDYVERVSSLRVAMDIENVACPICGQEFWRTKRVRRLQKTCGNMVCRNESVRRTKANGSVDHG